MEVVVGPYIPREGADQGLGHGGPPRPLGQKLPRFGPYSRFLNVKPQVLSESQGDSREIQGNLLTLQGNI